MTAPEHELKCWPVYFQRVWTGDKTFEVRLDDRGFQRGDRVVLREWDPKPACTCPLADNRGQHLDTCEKYSGRTISARIGHVMASTSPRGNQRGFVGMGYVVFSLCEPALHDGRPQAASPATAAARILAAARTVHA